MIKSIYISPRFKEVNIPLRNSVCQQISNQILEYLASEDQLDNSDDF